MQRMVMLASATLASGLLPLVCHGQLTLVMDLRRLDSSAVAQSGFSLVNDLDATLPGVAFESWPASVSSTANSSGGISSSTGSGRALQESSASALQFVAIAEVEGRGTRPPPGRLEPFGAGGGRSLYQIRFRTATWIDYTIVGTLGATARAARHEISIRPVDGPPIHIQTLPGPADHSGRFPPGEYIFTALAETSPALGAGRGVVGRGDYDIVVSFAVGVSCEADFNLSGGTPDGDDVDSYFSAWIVGDGSADFNRSGGVPDGDDIDAFFAAWLIGC